MPPISFLPSQFPACFLCSIYCLHSLPSAHACSIDTSTLTERFREGQHFLCVPESVGISLPFGLIFPAALDTADHSVLLGSCSSQALRHHRLSASLLPWWLCFFLSLLWWVSLMPIRNFKHWNSSKLEVKSSRELSLMLSLGALSTPIIQWLFLC